MTELEGLTQRLAWLRTLAGSNHALAKAAGVSEGAVRYWLKGAHPYDSTLQQLARTLGVDYLWLTTGRGTPPEKLEEAPEQSTCRIMEEAPIGGNPYPRKTMTHLPASSKQLLHVIRMLAGHCPASSLVQVLERVYQDPKLHAAELPELLTQALLERQRFEREHHQVPKS